MIRYSKRFWGALTLTRWYGSAFPRALPFSLVAAAAAGLLQHFWAERAADIWKHPYPFQTFAFIVGFMIVFRYARAPPLCARAALRGLRHSTVTAWHHPGASRAALPARVPAETALGAVCVPRPPSCCRWPRTQAPKAF